MKNALILNFTGNTYHFGCYGTAYEIYHRLLELGYCPNYLSVQVTHSLKGYPQTGEDFIDPKFVNHFVSNNPALFATLQEADIVLVNGEGTLHRLSQGSMSLLYMIYIASQLLRKPTYLINHSCYPGGNQLASDIDILYQTALANLSDRVIREPFSAAFYNRAKLTHRQGFDSLPLFMGRYDLLDLRSQQGVSDRILLTGGIAFDKSRIPAISEKLLKYKNQFSFAYLTGAKLHPALEDKETIDLFRQSELELESIEAPDFSFWCETIASARLLISGRFHYSIAALALAVPCISLPSNTPKTEGIYNMLEADGYLRWDHDLFSVTFASLLEQGLDNGLTLTPEKRLQMLSLGENNYTQLNQ